MAEDTQSSERLLFDRQINPDDDDHQVQPKKHDLYIYRTSPGLRESNGSSQLGISSTISNQLDNQDDDRFISSDKATDKVTEYKTTPYRWLILLVIFSTTICQTCTITSLAAVVIPVTEAFHLSSTVPVNFCAVSFSLCAIPMTFVAVWAYANYSTNLVLRVATTGQYLGGMIRLISLLNGQFWPIVVGTTIQACAAPFIINSVSIVATKWFSDKERALATSIMTLGMPLGTALAFLLTSFFFADSKEDTITNLNNLLKFQAVLFTAIFLLFQLVMRDKPAMPPSAAALAPIENRNFRQAFALMQENKSFMLVCISFALMFGYYVALGNLLSNFFAPFDFSVSEIADIGLYLLGAGVFGAVVVSIWLDRTATYRMTTIVIIAGNTIFLAATNESLYHIEYSYGLFMTSLLLKSVVGVAFIPVALGFAAELTFPLQPALVNGSLMLAGQFSAFIQSLMYAYMLNIPETYKDGTEIPKDLYLEMQKDAVWWAFSIMVLITIIAFIMAMFVKEDLRRLRYSTLVSSEVLPEKKSGFVKHESA